MIELLEALRQRCEDAGLSAEIQDRQNVDLNYRLLLIRVPAGREMRDVAISEGEWLQEISESQFERCQLIAGYEAVWCPSLRFIECGIDQGPSAFPFPLSSLVQRLFRLLNSQEERDTGAQRVVLPSPDQGPRLSLGFASVEHAALQNRTAIRPPRLYRRLTIRLDEVQVTTHDRARDLLERLSNAALFQLDLAIDVPLLLAEERGAMVRRRRPARREPVSLQPPAFEYDQEAITLYWYARTATRIPLLQFLAFYQVLEFYFPTYSQREAQQAARTLLKDPRFNVNKDADIARLLATVRSSGGRGFGDEKSQLRATLAAIIRDDDLRRFLTEDPARREFFTSKEAAKLSKQKTLSGPSRG